MTRLVRELAARHSEDRVAAAVASLSVSSDGRVASVSRGPNAGVPLASFSHEGHEHDVVRVEPSVYATTPTARGRVALLEAAASLADRVEVHVPLAAPEVRASRIVLDAPRRAARRLGLDLAEPGDRWVPAFAHAFFDDEPLVVEASHAGLHFEGRRGAWVLLARGAASGTPPERAATFSAELARAARIVGVVERARRRPPADAVATMRALGVNTKRRGVVGRARLRRAIGWLDAALPGGPSCLRRILAELALDAGAATETLVFGLDVGRTGHVAFKDSEDRSFDVAFEIPP
jgi:hypothetical protein